MCDSYLQAIPVSVSGVSVCKILVSVKSGIGTDLFGSHLGFEYKNISSRNKVRYGIYDHQN